jgi:hypothetical protein
MWTRKVMRLRLLKEESGSSVATGKRYRKVRVGSGIKREARDLEKDEEMLGEEAVIGWSKSGKTRGDMLYGAGKWLGDGNGESCWR